MNKPFSQACENNKAPILSVLVRYFVNPGQVFEIGSGTGQHAVFFAAQLPHLNWQPTDVAEHLAGIQMWLNEAELENILPPLVVDVRDTDWILAKVDYIFSANTVHIMSWSEVELMFAGIGGKLKAGGYCCLYGPFNYHGHHTSESNARFDQWLQQRDPLSGLRDFDAIQKLAIKAGLQFETDYEMPANNRILVWQKS